MSPIEPVAFVGRRAHAPRLSAPYVPGRRAPRFWTEDEKAIVREQYPKGGLWACIAHLPAHKQSRSGIYQMAKQLGLRAPRSNGPKQRLQIPVDIDDQIRAAWPELDGMKRGAVNALADRLGVPRWWLTKRAVDLNLTRPHRKEPPWTAAELALLERTPLHNLKRAARVFREHGFVRSATAIKVKSVRLHISRRALQPLSAAQAAKIVGFACAKSLSAFCVSGALKATRRDDDRLPQQGGHRWMIEPHDLRRFVINHIERIDLRKVDKFEFVHLLTASHTAAAPAVTETKPMPERDAVDDGADAARQQLVAIATAAIATADAWIDSQPAAAVALLRAAGRMVDDVVAVLPPAPARQRQSPAAVHFQSAANDDDDAGAFQSVAAE